ncbi:hypothetical protein LguiB_028170 [Lonicera macranthoides]
MDNERGFDKVVRCQLSLATCYRLASQNKATTLECISLLLVTSRQQQPICFEILTCLATYRYLQSLWLCHRGAHKH